MSEWVKSSLKINTLLEGSRILHVEVPADVLDALLGESWEAVYTNKDLKSVSIFESDISTPERLMLAVRSYGDRIDEEDVVSDFVMNIIEPTGMIREEINPIHRNSTLYECNIKDMTQNLTEAYGLIQKAADKLRRLKRGRRVKFMHSQKKTTLSGAFRGLFVRQGKPYAQIASGQTTYYVPAHHVML